MTDKDLYAGLIRLHVLHHAGEGPIYGLGLIEELEHHGYEISAGTLYPLLHGLERRGYLVSAAERLGRSSRRVYRITPVGRAALAEARLRVKELFGELFEHGHEHGHEHEHEHGYGHGHGHGHRRENGPGNGHPDAVAVKGAGAPARRRSSKGGR